MNKVGWDPFFPEECQDVLRVLDDGLSAEGRHGVVEDDGDAVVEEGLAEDEEVELHVDADLLEDGEHGHRIHRRDQRGEGQARRRVQLADHPGETIGLSKVAQDLASVISCLIWSTCSNSHKAHSINSDRIKQKVMRTHTCATFDKFVAQIKACIGKKDSQCP